MKRRVSLKDLAKELGVSISTVSRALKDHPDLSEDLIVKVKELAMKRNYTPNPMAMALLKQETKTIGVVVPEIATHFYSTTVSGIENAAKESGYFIVITSSEETFTKEKENIENLINLRVDGLIVCLAQDTSDFSHFDKIAKSDIPLVFFDRVCRVDEFSSVVIDNSFAAKQLTKHLFDNGYNRIALIAGPSELNITKERTEGYIQGLQECGLSFDPNLLINTTMGIESAAIATQKLMGLKYPPNAIIGINDKIIFSCMKELKRKGIKIPDQVGLVGFADDYHATEVEPNLTSISHPTYEIGRETARIILSELQTDSAKTVRQITMQPKLNIRTSSLRNKTSFDNHLPK